MAERGRATALKRKQFKTSKERAVAVVIHRMDNWPDLLRHAERRWPPRLRWLPRLRKGGGQKG